MAHTVCLGKIQGPILMEEDDLVCTPKNQVGIPNDLHVISRWFLQPFEPFQDVSVDGS